MKSALSYVLSLFVSVLLVLTLICTAGSLVANINIKEDKLHVLASENDLAGKTRSQLDKYFTARYNSTGIPSDTYMDAIDEAYLSDIIIDYIDSGFYSLRTGVSVDEDLPVNIKNKKLEADIDKFFIEAAQNTDTKMDDKFEEKLDGTKASAYNIIKEYCDAYKFNSLQKHGVLAKLTPVYSKLDIIVIVSTIACAVLMLILLLINLRSKSAVLFWIGVSSLIAGVISAAPSGYLLATEYFKRFTIKQPQVYAAYTSAMTAYTEAFLAAAICLIAAGICFIIIYRTVTRTDKKAEPTAL